MSLYIRLFLCLVILHIDFVFASSQTEPDVFIPKLGDLLFQDLNCGELCNGINSVTYGYHNTYVSHVALVIQTYPNLEVVEAISHGVVITPLKDFLNRSRDENGNPRVMVGRLKTEYQTLIPYAIIYAKAQLAKPYNASFIMNNGKSFYCSELIYSSYKVANHGISVFAVYPMDFTNGKNSKILPVWQKYYANLEVQVPQGKLGSNPGEFSRESILNIVHFYGKLRIHKS